MAKVKIQHITTSRRSTNKSFDFWFVKVKNVLFYVWEWTGHLIPKYFPYGTHFHRFVALVFAQKGETCFYAWIKTLCSYELAKKVSYNSLQLRWEREREEKNKQLERKQISEGSWHWLYHNLWRNLFQFKDTIEGNYWYFLTLLRLLLLNLITRLLADVVFKIQCRYVIFIFRSSRC